MPKKPDTSHQKASSIFEGLPLFQVFDSIDEPIYICDPDTYDVLYVNQSLRSLFDDVLGKKCYNIFQNLGSPCPFCTNKFIFGKNAGKTHIWEFQNKVTQRWYHCIDRAVPWTDGKMVRYEMAIDITERKKAEKEKEEMLSRLFETEKMKAIAVLTGGIAHDINNLLTAIHGFANVAMDSIDNTLPEYDSLDQICQVVLRANKLTDKLLGFSRKHPSEFKAVNINEMIEDMKKLLYSFIRNGITISFNLIPTVNYIKADTHKIEQVIMNLVMNAKDAMPEGGKIIVKTENVTLKDNEIKKIPGGRSGEFVCLSVIDTGTGIKNDLQEKIFEPFYTSKPNGKGTGLGLSVVNDIVAQHSGFITVSSKSGTGTEFRIYLPCARS